MNHGSSIVRTPPLGSKVYSFRERLREGKVLDRPNRFLVNIESDEGVLKCHLHDPGRLKELIFRGNRVKYRATNGIKTKHSITAALDGEQWILTDTRVHSEIASVFLPETVEREVKVGNHRMDFRSGDMMIEVKGCTMLRGGIATFPDAPTVRGREHLELLRNHVADGNRALLVILTFRDNATGFTPNAETDPAFAQEFRRALKSGVDWFIPKFSFEDGDIVYRGEINPTPENLP